MNPYWGLNAFSSVFLFFKRLLGGFEGVLFPDEIQIGVLSFTAISCGLISPFLILRKMGMFANSLSHTILLGVVLAFLVGSTFWGAKITDISILWMGAFIAALITAVLTNALKKVFHLQEDASIGLVFTTLLSLGVILVTLYTKNGHLSVEIILGNADLLQRRDLQLSFFLFLLNATSLLLFFPRFQLLSFDPHLAKLLGIRSRGFEFLFLSLVALTLMGAFRSIGVVLVLAYLVIPFLTARLFAKTLKSLLVWTPFLGVLASFLGVMLSRHFLSVYGLALSTAGLSVCVMGSFYFLGVFVDTFLHKLHLWNQTKKEIF